MENRNRVLKWRSERKRTRRALDTGDLYILLCITYAFETDVVNKKVVAHWGDQFTDMLTDRGEFPEKKEDKEYGRRLTLLCPSALLFCF